MTPSPSGRTARFGDDLLYERGDGEVAGEVHNITDAPARAEMTELLAEALRAIEAPKEQLERLGVG